MYTLVGLHSLCLTLIRTPRRIGSNGVPNKHTPYTIGGVISLNVHVKPDCEPHNPRNLRDTDPLEKTVDIFQLCCCEI